MLPTSCYNHEFYLACINDTEIGLYVEDVRIDKETLPEGFYRYEIRHTDDGFMDPCTLEDHVLVNFCGTFITDHEIKLDNDGEFNYINIDSFADATIKQASEFLGKKEVSSAIGYDIPCYFCVHIPQPKKVPFVEEEGDDSHKDL